MYIHKDADMEVLNTLTRRMHAFCSWYSFQYNMYV